MELQAGPLRVVTGARHLLLAIVAGALAGSLLDASDPRARPGSGTSATSVRVLPEAPAADAFAPPGVGGGYSFVRDSSGTIMARTGALSVVFGAEGPEFRARTSRLGLVLSEVRQGLTTTLPASARPRAAGNEVTYSRGNIDEWYRTGPTGVEQGFVIRRPSGGVSGHTSLTLRVVGAVRPSLRAGTVVFRAMRGSRYTGSMSPQRESRTTPGHATFIQTPSTRSTGPAGSARTRFSRRTRPVPSVTGSAHTLRFRRATSGTRLLASRRPRRAVPPRYTRAGNG